MTFELMHSNISQLSEHFVTIFLTQQVDLQSILLGRARFFVLFAAVNENYLSLNNIGIVLKFPLEVFAQNLNYVQCSTYYYCRVPMSIIIAEQSNYFSGNIWPF